MLRCTIGVARQGVAAFLACIAMSGIALAQGLPATAAPAPSAASAPPPNASAVPPPISVSPAPNAAAAPPAPQLTEAQLDQLVAPVALYPDPLLAQILMASTYPLEVVEAARWVDAPANQALTGAALTAALQTQDWDPSVKALAAFPRVLDNMNNQLQWTEDLGNAFLAQQGDVMAAVQSLRHQAMAAGNLEQTPQCRCAIQVSGATISILPAEPQVVCVPVYSPVAYGRWSYPAYPPDYFPVPTGFAYAPGFWIGFQPPIVLASFGPFWGWGRVDWGRRDIAVDSGRWALASGGRAAFSGGVWVHNPAHRGGVPYADTATRARFNAARVSALTMAARGGGARDATAAARFGGAAHVAGVSGEAGRPGGRFGAAAAIHGGGVAPFHSEAAYHGAPASHGGPAARAGEGFHGAAAAHGAAASRAGPTVFHGGPAFHGGSPHRGGEPHVATGGPHGGGPHGGGPARGPNGGQHGGGAPHFAMGGSPHGGGGPHGASPHGASPHGGGPHGGGPGGHHG
jgi:Protein of unknown function (DUF3300)